jgi:hypothetical protein
VNNNVSIDGSRLLDIGSNNGTIITPNNDFVQEVKVQVSNYAAEYGNSAVQISAVTKSGGKDFHGSLYTYWRPWQVAANDRSRSSAGLDRPHNRFIYPGGTISGPVLLPWTDFNKDRDKMFFFLGLESQRQFLSADTRFAVVPTLKQRQGDFSEFTNGTYLQQTLNLRVPGGYPGAGNPITNGNLAPYIDPIGQALINLYPQPNGIFAGGLYNYATSAPIETNRFDWKMRFDYKVTENTSLFVRWGRETEATQYAYGVWWAASRYELPEPVQGTNLGRSLAVSVTTIISPTTVNEVVFSGSKLKLDNDYENPEKVSRSGLGLNNFTLPFGVYGDQAPLAIYAWGQGLGEFWSPGALPIFAYNDSFSVTDNLSKLVGSHNLKFGGLVEQANKKQNFNNGDPGTIVLGGGWGNGTSGSDFGDLLVGRPAQLQQGTPSAVGHFRFYNYEGYAQDSWKVKPNFTLEYGVRLSYLPNNYERDSLGAVFDPSAYVRGAGQYLDGDPARPNGILLAARGEISKAVVDDPGVKFAPRFGFAWDIFGTAKTVVRGGTGVFYNRVQGNYQYGVIRIPPNAYAFTADAYAFSGLTYTNFGDIDPFSAVGGFTPASQDPNGNQIPRIVTMSLSVGQRLPFDSVLEVAYVGTQARHLPQTFSINAIQPGQLTGSYAFNGNVSNLNDPIIRAALDNAVTNQFRPYPDFSDVTYAMFTGTSTYHSLQATLSRQQGQNFQYFLTYTFSKALGTNFTNETATAGEPLDTRGRIWGILPHDRTHIFNATYIWELPDGARGFMDNGFGDAVLNGWKVSGITTMQSGIPLTPTISGDYNSDATRRAYYGTPSGTVALGFSGDPRLDGKNIGEHLFDGSAFFVPSFGNYGTYQSPYYLRSPSRYNTDITLFKTFDFTERQNLEFRVGFFNIFNQAFANPNLGDILLQLNTSCVRRVSGIPNGNGGTANDICDPTGGFVINNPDAFGTIVNKHGHRLIEFALKYNF